MTTIPVEHQTVIETILETKYGITKSEYTAVQLTAAKNNHVFRINFARPISDLGSSATAPAQALTVPMPKLTSELVLRMSKANVSVNDAIRIRNEVAFLSLGREALASSGISSLVPEVYGWADGGDEPNWILEEYKEGEVFSQADFMSLDASAKTSMMLQIAKVVKSFQDYRLQPGMLYGGLSFDDSGRLFSVGSIIPCGGPFESFRAAVKGMCIWQLEACDRNEHIRGWNDIPGLRQRISEFFDHGLDKVLEQISEDRPTIIHGDLALPNMLWDRTTNHLTAILDFDFAHIAHPISEYLFSLWDLQGLLMSSVDAPPSLHRMMLSGFTEEPADDDAKLAKQWDDALKSIGAKRICEIPDAEAVADIWWFSQELCQAFWFNASFLETQTEDTMKKMKDGEAGNLDKYLKLWGY